MHVPAPMLASPAGNLPALDDWAIEPKWDGIRVIADVNARGAHLWSRNDIDKAPQFPEVSEALEKLAASIGSVTLDGELIAIDSAGRPLRFQALQSRHSTGASKLDRKTATRTAFVVFDILAASGKDVRRLPFHLRRKVLESLVKKSAKGLIRRGESHRCGTAGATKLLDAAMTEGWEGLILKQIEAPYQSGMRSPFWRKVKLEHEQEFVIGGYTLPTDGADRENFGALLVGYYDDDGDLQYAGKVGTGYTRKMLSELGRKLASMTRPKSPFADVPVRHRGSVWVKPTLVAQVRYNEMTASGVLRQPSFQGLRDDKRAADVRLETETSRGAILETLRCRE